MTPEELHLHHMLRDQMIAVAGFSASVCAYSDGIAAQLSILHLAQGCKVDVQAVIAILRGLQGAAESASDDARQKKREDFARNPLQANGK